MRNVLLGTMLIALVLVGGCTDDPLYPTGDDTTRTTVITECSPAQPASNWSLPAWTKPAYACGYADQLIGVVYRAAQEARIGLPSARIKLLPRGVTELCRSTKQIMHATRRHSIELCHMMPEDTIYIAGTTLERLAANNSPEIPLADTARLLGMAAVGNDTTCQFGYVSGQVLKALLDHKVVAAAEIRRSIDYLAAGTDEKEVRRGLTSAIYRKPSC